MLNSTRVDFEPFARFPLEMTANLNDILTNSSSCRAEIDPEKFRTLEMSQIIVTLVAKDI
jgi:hypothetical protein